MRLIDADALIEAMKKTESEYENAMTCPSWWSAFNVISEQPTAYDIDKVVEELEKREEHYVEMLDWQGQSAICDAIEIVKQGGVRKEVEYMNTTEEYKGCRNCKYQPEPMQTCDWLKHQKEVYRVCPMWELKKIKVVE